MPIRDQYPGGVVEKQWARIVTVDTRTRRIEAQLKDFGIVQIALWEIPGGFRWPIEGEEWLIVRENGIWFLRAPSQGDEVSLPIEELNQGDTLIGVDDTQTVVLGLLKNPSLGTTIGFSTLEEDGIEVTMVSTWGIDADDDPYFDPSGAVKGEEAVLIVMDDGSLAITSL